MTESGPARLVSLHCLGDHFVMPHSNVELACQGCGTTAIVKASVINSQGVIARPTGWTHGGRGMAVIGAKDYCPACSPLMQGTPWNETPSSFRPADDELLVVLMLEQQ